MFCFVFFVFYTYFFILKITHEFFVQVEKLLIEQNRLREQKKLQEESLALREREIQILQRTLPQPNLKVRETQTNSHLLCTDS